ncbi:hypothetical protein SASPL_155806 [Salvia splendens]|uniref:Uncharacterized protein n=1 Tax=Salvia splendens TaxID=180675 RepID=A0A8X8YX08_SALSN|nr:hypothetical protein SASPL_155806 [Salvia splendens]
MTQKIRVLILGMIAETSDVRRDPINSVEAYRRLDGTMPISARDRAVKDFNLLPEVSVMIMSLKAASLGLNMVAACNKRPVSVYRLTVKDTVEDRILALQQRKRRMVAYAYGECETGTRQTISGDEALAYWEFFKDFTRIEMI